MAIGINFDKDDDEDLSMNDARIRRYKEEAYLGQWSDSCTNDDEKIRDVIRHYVRMMYDRADKKTLEKLINKEIKELKKLKII